MISIQIIIVSQFDQLQIMKKTGILVHTANNNLETINSYMDGDVRATLAGVIESRVNRVMFLGLKYWILLILLQNKTEKHYAPIIISK